LASVKNRSHRGSFCLGFHCTRGHRPCLLPRFSLHPRPYGPCFLFFLNSRTLLASVFGAPEAIWAFFGLGFCCTRGHMCFFFFLNSILFWPRFWLHLRPKTPFLLRFWYEPRPNTLFFFKCSFCFGVITTFKPANFVQHPAQTRIDQNKIF